ncbi:elongation of very long chain fatty acids protein 4-like [Drosophila rhopaloa]|uniref:Elongation of very long chain fatty acids protein 4-like n=1 Tax=Drosophila rhopaloa TaxID=1041015 RepID=A0A6P4FPR9_DRORH|nr:elongation of very long chain fatty acids protein 4-like [Drosophila rhopaloa]
MYTYFFAVAWHPHVKSKFWWKRYITKLNFLQFVILFGKTTLIMWLNLCCSFPIILQLSTSLMVILRNFNYQ